MFFLVGVFFFFTKSFPSGCQFAHYCFEILAVFNLCVLNFLLSTEFVPFFFNVLRPSCRWYANFHSFRILKGLFVPTFELLVEDVISGCADRAITNALLMFNAGFVLVAYEMRVRNHIAPTADSLVLITVYFHKFGTFIPAVCQTVSNVDKLLVFSQVFYFIFLSLLIFYYKYRLFVSFLYFLVSFYWILRW